MFYHRGKNNHLFKGNTLNCKATKKKMFKKMNL